ncbi:MAG: tetratricopeptide repeat-containing sulfotransferase family protein [Steroidobacteraceae bacterium]
MDFQDALGLHRQGRTDEAALAYERLLRTDPVHYGALIHLGVLRLSQGQAEAAETLLRRAVAVAPDGAEALGNLAASLQAQGRHAEAAARYEQALRDRPDLLDARFGLAACQQATGRHDAAIENYQAILAVTPAHPEAQYGLATLLAGLGRTEEAIAAFRAALAADPDFAEASLGIGKLLARANALNDAIACYRQALDVDPDYIEARAALGAALSRLDRDDEAMVALQAVLAAEPDNPDAHNGIGVLLERKLQHGEAMTHYRAALAAHPEHVDAMLGMANALRNTGGHQEALMLARRVLAQRPESASATSLLGVILAELGEMEEALPLIRRAATLAPNRPEILYHAALLSKVQPEDGTIEALEAALLRFDSFTPRDQCLLHFALAKAYDDVGERERSFTHLMRGNAIKRSQTPYGEAAMLAGMARVAEVFTPALLSARQGMGDPSTVPVFIVGMPRSGTTLVEQILASHAEVFGAGERTELASSVRHLTAERIGASGLPEAVWTLAGEALRRMGRDYVAGVRRLAPDATRVIDKMPGNFLYLGLIRLILPNARIIHVRRNPVDTCLSCFSKLFTGVQPFAYELGELGRYYRAYERLMAHWRTVLPADILLELEYETLVDDFEPQVRRIVAHCGLPWDPACLEFHKTTRAVHTASVVQVRQPIHRGAVGRWRPDAALLQPLLDALAGR